MSKHNALCSVHETASLHSDAHFMESHHVTIYSPVHSLHFPARASVSPSHRGELHPPWLSLPFKVHDSDSLVSRFRENPIAAGPLATARTRFPPQVSRCLAISSWRNGTASCCHCDMGARKLSLIEFSTGFGNEAVHSASMQLVISSQALVDLMNDT